MSHETPRPLDEFEAQLAALRPASGGVDRDALLYAAGRAVGEARVAGRRRSLMTWASPLLSVACLLAAATFAALWWNELQRSPTAVAITSTPDAAPPTDVIVQDSPPPAAVALSAESYFRLRHVALDEGIDAWPERAPRGGTPWPRAGGAALPLDERDG